MPTSPTLCIATKVYSETLGRLNPHGIYLKDYQRYNSSPSLCDEMNETG